MMHFHFNDQLIGDHAKVLHDRARTYRVTERETTKLPWRGRISVHLRRTRRVAPPPPAPVHMRPAAAPQ